MIGKSQIEKTRNLRSTPKFFGMINFKRHIAGGDLAPRLTIEGGKFIFLNPLSTTRQELARDTDWSCASEKRYETQSLRAAFQFRRHGDSIAEKFFNRRFQSAYSIPSGRRLPSFLDPHQLRGVEWILTRKRSYLAHAPGAGKTAEAIVAALLAPVAYMHLPPRSTLVLCPPDLCENWRREILRFTDMTTEELTKGTRWLTVGVVGRTVDQARVLWRGDFLIVPYSMLTKDWVQAGLAKIRPHFIIADEASALKESTSDRSLAFYGGRYKGRDFPGIYQDAKHVVFMDGSPMPNRPMELWAPTYALVPDVIECMSQRDFGFRYCGARINERGEYEFKFSSNEEELKTKLRKSFMHVVTEDELTHPERRRSMLFMDEDVRTPKAKEWERRNLPRILKAVENGEEDDPTKGELASMRAELGLRKVEWIARYVRRRLTEKNESILLFAWHRKVVERLGLELVEFDPGIVMGGTHASYREECFKLFQSGVKKLIVGNIAAMGRGHNLQRADRVIFGEYAWSDETNKQAEKRASRRGSEKSFVRCEYIVCPESMDERVLHALFTKEARVKRVIG